MLIEVYNSCIKVNDYEMGTSEKLERYLSVWDKNIHNYSWCAFYYDEENSILTLPKINPYFVQNCLGSDVAIMNYEEDFKGKKAVFKTNIKPRNEIQIKAIEFLLNEQNTRKMICLKPGEGKTYCAINYLSHLKQRCLIIVDQERIMDQWKKSFLKFTDIHESEIHLIAGYQSLDKILDSKKDLPYKVFIASHRTLSSFMQKDPNKFTQFMQKASIGVKVIDEAHVEVKNTVLLDGFSNVTNTIYLTATPGRSDHNENILFSKIFKYVKTFDDTTSRNSKYHKIALISYNTNPTVTQEAECTSKRGFDLNKYSSYLFDIKQKEIHDILFKLLQMLKKKSGKIAIVIHNLNHISAFKDYLIEECNIDKDDIGIFCGLIKNAKDKEKQLERKIILTTEKQFGKAIDVEDLRFVLMTVPTSSEIITEQLLGRLRRLDGKDVMYFDLTDEGFKACRSQRTKRTKIFKKFATKIIKLKL